MVVLLGAFAFLFGACVGSFLNVLVLRHNTGRSVGGRSSCLSCSQRLEWYELVPIVSFFILRGRCRSCGTRLLSQYVFVEAVTGLLFLGLFLVFGLPATVAEGAILAGYAISVSLLVAIFTYDIRHHIIPNLLVYPFCATALLMTAAGISWPLTAAGFLDFAAGPFVSLPIALLWSLSRGRWMGLGDAKLALGMGWLLGFAGGFLALLLAFWIGAFVSVVLLALSYTAMRLWPATKRLTMKSEVPFAPFLVIGTLIALLFDFNVSNVLTLFSL